MDSTQCTQYWARREVRTLELLHEQQRSARIVAHV
jgi:hypothetical protein